MRTKQINKYAILLNELEWQRTEATNEKEIKKIELKIEDLVGEVIQKYGYEAMLDIDDVIMNINQKIWHF